MRTIKNLLKKSSKLIAISLAMLSLHGCATICGDNTRTLTIHSEPQGAGIYVDGQRVGTTPATITLSNYIYGGKSVLIKKEGYYDQAMIVPAKFQPCGLWNILFFPGFLIDGATGTFVKIDPAHLTLCTQLEVVKSEVSSQAQR